MINTLRFRFMSVALLLLTFHTGVCFASDMANGSKLYSAHCISCHGSSGIAVMMDAPNFTKGEGLMAPDSTLLLSIKNGKNAMPAYQGILSDAEILDVIAYLRTLF